MTGDKLDALLRQLNSFVPDVGLIEPTKPVEELGGLDDPRAVGPLIGVLRTRDYPSIKAAAEALVKLKNHITEEQLQMIIYGLEGGWDEYRWTSTSILYGTRNPWNVDPALKRDAYRRFFCAYVLGETEKEGAVEPLIKALGDTSLSPVVDNVYPEAAKALAKLKKHITKEQINRIIRGAGKPKRQNEEFGPFGSLISRQERLGYIAALGELKVKEATELLLEALEEENAEVCREAVSALGKMGDWETTEPLIRMLKHMDYNVRLAAVVALGEMKNQAATEPLISALGDTDRVVREKAEKALMKLGNEKGVLFVEVLQGQNTDRIPELAEHLDLFVNILGVANTPAAENVMTVLKDHITEEQFQGIITGLFEGDEFRRRGCTKALGVLGRKEAVEYLITALEDFSTGVGAEAAEALGKLKEKITDEQYCKILNGLTGKDEEKWWGCSVAVGELGRIEAVIPLIRMIGHRDVVAREGLDRLEEKEHELSLQKLGECEKTLIAALSECKMPEQKSRILAWIKRVNERRNELLAKEIGEDFEMPRITKKPKRRKIWRIGTRRLST